MDYRTFLAVDIDERSRHRLIEAFSAVVPAGCRVKPVALPNLHLTLAFLGEVDSGRLARVCALAGEVASHSKGFEMSLSGLQVVPPRGNARLVWSPVDDGRERLRELHDRLTDELLRSEGLGGRDRGFRPHVTVARVRRSRRREDKLLRQAVDRLRDTSFGRTCVEHLNVYTSELTPEGPVYARASQCPLSG
jgi:RNA 2',3'-cyclic 3'-phosphodiesterase